MKSTISIAELRTLESPFASQGRTFISIYIPKAPIHLVTKQIDYEISRTEKSTNWKVKGAVGMMLKQIKEFLTNLSEEIPDNGFVLFCVPKNNKESIINIVVPEKNEIDLFFYVLDERFYVKEEHFSFT